MHVEDVLVFSPGLTPVLDFSRPPVPTMVSTGSVTALAGQKTWILPTENDNRLSISVKSRPLLKNHHFVGLNT